MKNLSKRPLFRLTAITLAVGTLLSCASKPTVVTTPTPQPTTEQRVVIVPQPQSPVVTQPAPQTPTAPVQQYYSNFGDWKNDFINRTLAQGHSSADVYRLIGGASLNQQVISLDGRQAEFTKMPWEYVESAASNARVSQGKAKLSEYPSLLSRVQSQYGVPREIIVAIWGVESSFGANTGSTNLVDALSSLAYEGRRRSFAEGELLAMLQMVERGDVSSAQLTGSWAGGMGHTQFIPSTWVKYGVDGNHDGHKNPWVISDALSSTAHYLGSSGWVADVDAFYEVRLPAGFNYQLLNQKQSLDAWKRSGVQAVNGEYFGGNTPAELWLPAGANGPALLLTPNFDVIKVYNNSSSYALGVALLAKRIGGGSGITASWPKHEQPLSRSQIERLQQNLNNQGYNAGKVDGVAGANTRLAFSRWQSANGKIPDGFISQNSANGLIW